MKEKFAKHSKVGIFSLLVLVGLPRILLRIWGLGVQIPPGAPFSWLIAIVV
jgi:hypothetical protein